MIILLLLLLSTFSNISCQENILLRKPVATNQDPKNSKNLNDGTTETKFDFTISEFTWAVFDLKSVYQIQKFIIKTDNKIPNLSVSFYIGDSFMPCKFHTQKALYKPCKTGIKPQSKVIEIKCDIPGVKGQYVALIVGYSSLEKPKDNLIISDIEGYGSLISSGKQKGRPEIKSEVLEPITKQTFKISPRIRNNVPFITMPGYSNGINFVSGNCESIAYDADNKLSFAIACQTGDGKGRITIFGKENFLQEVITKNTSNIFKMNILRWLSPSTKNPKLIKSEEIKSLQNLREIVKMGDIIDFSTFNAVPKDIHKELVLMLLNGSIAMNIDHTFWVKTSSEARNSYMEILNIFNVEYSSTILNWNGDKNITLSDQDFNEKYLAIEEQFIRISKNHDSFLNMSEQVISGISEFSTNVLSKSKLRQHMEKLINKYYDLLQWICPCTANRLSDKNDRIIVAAFSALMKHQLLAHSNYKIPCVDLFPGDFSQPPPKKDVTITIKSQSPQTLHPVGYYLAPGDTLDYTISKIIGQWWIRAGCHSDILTDGRPEWYRYPTVYIPNVLLQDKGSVYSPFGGVIWLQSEKENETITITLTNVVATPFFNTRDKKSMRDWDKNRNNAGLWAQIAGSNIVYCVPSYKIKNFNESYLYNLMNMWDMVVRSDYHIKSVDWKLAKPELVVLDIMISFGYGHSGYPIEVFDDWFEGVFDMNIINKEGSWGLCHEIGHNMQESVWTFEGCGEVTNNLLCLYNYKMIWNLPYYGSEKLKLQRDYDRSGDVIKYLDQGADFNVWKSDPFLALVIYAQLANNFGFRFYKEVFFYYRNLKIEINQNDEKMAMWMNVTSIVSKRNLLPIFDFWGFPIQDKIRETLKPLPCFFPDDFYSKLSKSRTTYIESKYKNCDKKPKFVKDLSITDISRESLPNFIEVSNIKDN